MGEKLRIDPIKFRNAVSAVAQQNNDLHRFCRKVQATGVNLLGEGWNYNEGERAVKDVVYALNQTIKGLDHCWNRLVLALNKYGRDSSDHYNEVEFNISSDNTFEEPHYRPIENYYDEDMIARGAVSVESMIYKIRECISNAYIEFSKSGVEGTGVQEYFSAFRSATSKAGDAVQETVINLCRVLDSKSKTFGSKLAKARNEAIQATNASSKYYWGNH